MNTKIKIVAGLFALSGAACAVDAMTGHAVQNATQPPVQAPHTAPHTTAPQATAKPSQAPSRAAQAPSTPKAATAATRPATPQVRNLTAQQMQEALRCADEYSAPAQQGHIVEGFSCTTPTGVRVTAFHLDTPDAAKALEGVTVENATYTTFGYWIVGSENTDYMNGLRGA